MQDAHFERIVSGASRRAAEATQGTRVRLNRAADAELAHASLERGALHAKEAGGSLGSGDAPLRLLQGAEDVLALGFFESGDRGGGEGRGS